MTAGGIVFALVEVVEVESSPELRGPEVPDEAVSLPNVNGSTELTAAALKPSSSPFSTSRLAMPDISRQERRRITSVGGRMAYTRPIEEIQYFALAFLVRYVL